MHLCVKVGFVCNLLPNQFHLGLRRSETLYLHVSLYDNHPRYTCTQYWHLYFKSYYFSNLKLTSHIRRIFWASFFPSHRIIERIIVIPSSMLHLLEVDRSSYRWEFNNWSPLSLSLLPWPTRWLYTLCSTFMQSFSYKLFLQLYCPSMSHPQYLLRVNIMRPPSSVDTLLDETSRKAHYNPIVLVGFLLISEIYRRNEK